ncbi:uncharacterized protein LOC130630027 [Hydractinia symbiolongicarpus]|uniref:uncharacterized protein LOC130630027 n=1 Tax=Hydractinia symbiolongicarpus TaxID=13093 RepID=UPI00254AD848|nr:uncharacterized protein LOC130630027 [Hydractinia symbiolongicarpus]
MLSMDHSPLPSPRLLSSNDNSPFPSPFHSPGTSPGNSPNPKRKVSPISQKSFALSPMASPKLTLKRAGSYRTKSKKVTSRLDDIIQKRKLGNRNRSLSSPDINSDCSNDEEREQTLSFSDHSDEQSDNGERKEITENSCAKNHARKHGSRKGSFTEHKEDKSKSPTIRKKSLNALMDLKNMVVTHGPRLRRSQSQRYSRDKKKDNVRDRKSSSFTTDDELSQYDGPLIKATTMFVPGYDFKTKQSTPLTPRRQSTPLFQRRGSREKIHSTDFNNTRQQSTPNLTRRGSKDKLKVLEALKTDDTRFKRSDSLPPSITLSTEEDDYDDEDTFANGDPEYIAIVDRQSALTYRHRKFAEKKKTTALNLPTNSGRVKQMSSGYEHGTVFWRRYKKKMNMAELERKHRSCEIVHDSIYRERAKSYEDGSAYWRRDDENRNYLSSPGSESGYASPTDNADHNTKEKRPVRPTVLHTTNLDEGLSNSWSYSQWKTKNKQTRHNLTPDLVRVIATDLCVTEL